MLKYIVQLKYIVKTESITNSVNSKATLVKIIFEAHLVKNLSVKLLNRTNILGL